MNYKLIKNSTYDPDLEENNNSDDEALLNVVKLKMFNIVLEFDRKNVMLLSKTGNLNIIYGVLESFSQFLAFEEYRNEFLGKEILNIFKTLEIHKHDSNENPEDISFQIAKFFFDTNKSKELYNSNEKGNLTIKNENKGKSFELIKNVIKFYEDLKSFRFFKISINNKYDFKAPAKLLSMTQDVENYHTLVIIKKAQLENWLSNDINPFVPFFLNVLTPFKNFVEISLEFKIPLDLIKLTAKQIHCLNLGKIMKKFGNNTILTVNPDLKIKKETENEFFKNYNLNLYESLNNFANQKCLNKVFKKNFNQITSEKFINLVNYLVSNEYLIQCRKFILPKLNFKRKYNTERIVLNNSLLFFTHVDKLNFILNDLDAESEFTKNQINDKNHSNSVSSKNFGRQIYFEDAIEEIKKSAHEDYEVIKNFFYFLTPDFDFDQICYFTGYREDLIQRIIKKFKFLFNIIVSAEDE